MALSPKDQVRLNEYKLADSQIVLGATEVVLDGQVVKRPDIQYIQAVIRELQAKEIANKPWSERRMVVT